MAKDAEARAARTEKLGAAIAEFEPLPFDGRAAARFGTLAALTLGADRDPKPRRLDLVIAAIIVGTSQWAHAWTDTSDRRTAMSHYPHRTQPVAGHLSGCRAP